MKRFNMCHPAVTAFYFLSILLVVMFSTNPVIITLALLGGIAFCVTIEKLKTFLKNLSFYIPLFIIIAISNPLFSHNGVTPLFFMNGNPITLEAILYGVFIGAMLIAVMYWFSCFNYIMTSDKLLFLLGNVSPKISLVISSALRFIPLLKVQAKRIRHTQKAMGLYTSDSWLDKLRGTVRVYSSLITWSLENAVDTGSSMKARGYGLKGRTHFALFRFTCSDAALLIFIVVIDMVVIAIMAFGKLNYVFYPRMSVLDINYITVTAYVAFGTLSFLPSVLEIKENAKWAYYRSKI